MPRSSKVWLVLLALCAVELALFYRSFATFFDGDSFFYFVYRITDFADLKRFFTSIDRSHLFRPVTHVSFSYLMYPLLGLHARWYSLMSTGFHVLNTLLVFGLLRKLTRSDFAAIAGTIFWGLNPVAIFITHGICFMADYLYAFFYLGGLWFFLRYRETQRIGYGLMTLLAFALSLGTKEAAVTLPLHALMVVLVIAIDRNERVSNALAKGRWLSLSLFVLLSGYLLAYYNIKGGAFYDQGAKDNYRLVTSVEAVTSKIGAFKSGLYFPFQHYPTRPMRQREILLMRAVQASLNVWLLGLCAFTLWSLVRRNRWVIAGLLWALIALMPVLLIMPTEFIHNLYLPLVGVALIVGVFVERLSAFLAARSAHAPRYLWAALFFFMGVAFLVNQDLFKSRDWRPFYETVAKSCVADLQRLHPTLAPHTTLYFRRSEENLVWLLYDGKLVNFFYKDPSLRIRFGDRDAFPYEAFERGQALVLVYDDHRFYDVTQEFRVDSTRTGWNLLNEFPEATVSFNREEPYPNYEAFDTPGGKPVFLAPLAIGDTFRTAMITIAGARVRFKTPVLTAQSKLELVAVMKFALGDGAQARIYFEHGGVKDLIYERYLNPKDRRWLEEAIDLGRFAGQSGRLSFECNSGPDRNTLADWLGWSRIWITHTRGNTLSPVSHTLGPNARLDLNILADASVAQFGPTRYLFSRAAYTEENSLIFFHSIARGGIDREALVMVPGSSISFYLKDLRPELTLRLMFAMPADTGSGALVRVLLVDDVQRRVVFKRVLNPAVRTEDRRWFEETIPLHNPPAPEARLVLECLRQEDSRGDLPQLGWHRVDLY